MQNSAINDKFMHWKVFWRHPVKFFAGERFAVAEICEDGIVGDRVALAVNNRKWHEVEVLECVGC